MRLLVHCLLTPARIAMQASLASSSVNVSQQFVPTTTTNAVKKRHMLETTDESEQPKKARSTQGPKKAHRKMFASDWTLPQSTAWLFKLGQEMSGLHLIDKEQLDHLDNLRSGHEITVGVAAARLSTLNDKPTDDDLMEALDEFVGGKAQKWLLSKEQSQTKKKLFLVLRRLKETL